MGKHKNRIQNTIIMEFMDKYPDIAKGFTKRDKPTVDSLWQQLAESLNSAGPPQFEVNGWKKKWTEWKSDVKRKLAQNKAESRATGGGPYSKHQLTTTDEAIVRLCGFSQSVEGVSGIAFGLNDDFDVAIEEELSSTSSKRPLSVESVSCIAIGLNEDVDVAIEEEMLTTTSKRPLAAEGVSGIAIGLNGNADVAIEEEMPSASSKRPLSSVLSTSAPKRIRTENVGDRIKEFLDEDNKRKMEINEKLDELIKIEKENASSLRCTSRAIKKGHESVANALTDLKKEIGCFSAGILKCEQEKIELTKRQLDLDWQKFAYEKDRTT